MQNVRHLAHLACIAQHTVLQSLLYSLQCRTVCICAFSRRRCRNYVVVVVVSTHASTGIISSTDARTHVVVVSTDAQAPPPE
jgi:hypothetical protein